MHGQQKSEQQVVILRAFVVS